VSEALFGEGRRNHVPQRLPHQSVRTKLLLFFVLVTAGLTCATLLVVRSDYQTQMQREVEAEARNAILTFQGMQHQRLIELNRKVDLMATLAALRNGEATTVSDVSQNPWKSQDCNLFALADRKGRIVALESTVPDIPRGIAQELFGQSMKDGGTSGWWFSGRGLYQIVLQPFYSDAPRNTSQIGTVIVGQEFDERRAEGLRRITSSQIALRQGVKIILSTLPTLQEGELARQLEDEPTRKEIRIGKERFFVDSVELMPGPRPGITLTVLKSYEGAMASLTRLNHLLIGVGLVAVVAGAGLAFLISDTFTRPLANLVAGVGALERGDFGYPLQTKGGDEVAQVTQAFDRMRNTLKKNEQQRQQLEGQLRQSQKMEALGQMAGGVAHDFNNLLTIIRGHSDILQEQLGTGHRLQTNSQQIVKAADRAAALTRQLLAFCRMQMLQPKILDLNDLVSEMCKLLRRLVREDIAFRFQAGESLGRVKADPGQIEQVIVNLTVNACDAMPEGGTLTIETCNVKVDEELARSRPPLQPGQYVLLAVSDTGHGMDANTRARIFEPFFTTKEKGKGTGLGLATVYGVVKQSGGCIWVESEPGKGARFEVYLPRVAEKTEIEPVPVKPAEPVRRGETVLIAEDEEGVRELASEFVESAGYKVLVARDGLEALAIVEQSKEPIHVLLTDVVMPNMQGPELAKRAKSLRNDMQIIYMSGYLEFNGGGGKFLEEGFFLQKPFSRDALVDKVAEALGNGACAVPLGSKAGAD
jgi:signal transduction histidine kinase